MTIKILDLFAGCGGLSLGFELFNKKKGEGIFELFMAVEIDKYTCNTLRNHYGKNKVIEGDITKPDIRNRVINNCKRKVSVILGGIPCQSFSMIGPRTGFGKKMRKFKNDKRDRLYEDFRDIVAAIKPNIVIFENVKGILSKKNRKGKFVIDNILSDFETLGYNLKNDKDGKKYMILNAADYGVPQRRERVLIIGIKKSWKNIKVPYIEATHYDSCSKKKEGPDNYKLLPYVSLFDAIGDLPEIEPKVTFTGLNERQVKIYKNRNRFRNSGSDKIRSEKKIFLRHLKMVDPAGMDFFSNIRSNGYEYIDHHICRSHQLSDIKLFSLMKEGEIAKIFMERAPKTAKKLIKYDMNSFKDKYRKQKWDSVCTTVFAHLEKDGNRFIHPAQPRTFTPREAARIQSFPDDFIFSGPMSSKFRQIGNAVPPLLSKNIALNIIKIW